MSVCFEVLSVCFEAFNSYALRCAATIGKSIEFIMCCCDFRFLIKCDRAEVAMWWLVAPFLVLHPSLSSHLFSRFLDFSPCSSAKCCCLPLFLLFSPCSGVVACRSLSLSLLCCRPVSAPLRATHVVVACLSSDSFPCAQMQLCASALREDMPHPDRPDWLRSR